MKIDGSKEPEQKKKKKKKKKKNTCYVFRHFLI